MITSNMNPAPPQRLTRALHLCVTALLVVLPFVALFVAYVALTEPETVRAELPHAHLLAPPGFMATFWALAVMVPAFLAGLFALNEMRQLFARYQRGEALSDDCAHHIRRIGVALLVGTFAAIFGQMLATLILSYANPPGQRVVALVISGWQIGVVLLSGFVTLIGHVMGEAARIAAENKAFV